MTDNNKAAQKVKRCAAAGTALLTALLLCACAGTSALPLPSRIPAPAETPRPYKAAPALAAEPTETPQPSEDEAPAQPPRRAVVAADDYVRVRAGAGTEFEQTGQLAAGSIVEVADERDGWLYVSDGSMTGWVSGEYMLNKRDKITDAPSGDWTQILINPTHFIPDGYDAQEVEFDDEYVSERIFGIARRMFDDAAEDGVQLTLISGYRSRDHQSSIYERKVQSYVDKGYTYEDAAVEAATITARPDTSEHQTGLAMDIVTPGHTALNWAFDETRAFKWLLYNAPEYGFIMRYQRGKEDVTKVIYEPWHWRYVGVETAIAVTASGQCWEEYLGQTD